MSFPGFISSHIPHIVIAAVLSFPAYKFSRWSMEKLGQWLWDSTVGAIQTDRQRLADASTDLKEIKGNHLVHLQASMDKMVSLQEQSNLIQAEQAGYLRGILEKK